MDLVCASMNLHEFMLFPGPCRDHTGNFFVLLLLASSSKGFAAWYDPLLFTDLADWWRSPDYLFFCFGNFLNPESGKFPQKSKGACRT